MNDYERVERVIRYLDEHHTQQPDLPTLARCTGLSLFHFHRLFSAWAGVTPKDFLQCLTLAHVKQLLSQGESVLGAALEAGLSGPGRLHDLCVSLESASPGELKSGGEGWTIAFGFADSPFGTCLVGESPRGVCHLSFVDPPPLQAIPPPSSEMPPFPQVPSSGGGASGGGGALARLQEDWPQAKLRRDDRAAERIAGRIFARGEDTADGDARQSLRAIVRGTAFQVRVWRALLAVPTGTVVTYGRLAAAVGQPTATRAVASAVAQNSLAYLIPCHRVIRQTGVIGKYRWGTVRKRAMLAWETPGTPAPGSAPGSTPNPPGTRYPPQAITPRSCCDSS